MRKQLLAIFCFFIVANVVGFGQTPACPSGATSAKLICMIPQIYGPGLQIQAVNFGGAPVDDHFQTVLTSNLSPLNSAIARQSAILPLASPSSGITFSWDAAAKTFVGSTDSYGPILGERADTIGKYKVSLGFSYQYFDFSNLDGVSLKNLPSVYFQSDETNTATGDHCSLSGDSTGSCGYIRDVVTTSNRVDLKVHQFTTFVTFGLTNRIDVSAAIPIESVHMAVYSNATIVNNIDASGNVFAHTFPFRTGCGSLNVPVSPCSNQQFSSASTSSGIGDITLRVKGTAWKGEKSGLALGADFRIPTGDSLNFLGSGAVGVRPFIVWSYRARVSPHALVGFEVDGSSQIAGDVTTGVKDKLPGSLSYVIGADTWITKRVTAAFDLVGQDVFQAGRVSVKNVPEPAACLDSSGQCDPGQGFATPTNAPIVTPFVASYNSLFASVGAKFRPTSNLLILGNVLFKLNNGGLGLKAVPMIGVAYTF